MVLTPAQAATRRHFTAGHDPRTARYDIATPEGRGLENTCVAVSNRAGKTSIVRLGTVIREEYCAKCFDKHTVYTFTDDLTGATTYSDVLGLPQQLDSSHVVRDHTELTTGTLAHLNDMLVVIVRRGTTRIINGMKVIEPYIEYVDVSHRNSRKMRMSVAEFAQATTPATLDEIEQFNEWINGADSTTSKLYRGNVVQVASGERIVIAKRTGFFVSYYANVLDEATASKAQRWCFTAELNDCTVLAPSVPKYIAQCEANGVVIDMLIKRSLADKGLI